MRAGTAAIPLNAEENTREAMQFLAQAIETHDGQPADTSLERAKVHAILAVAERLADLIELLRPEDEAEQDGGQADA